MSIREFDWSKAYSEAALARSWQQLRNYWRGEEVFADTLQNTLFDRLLRSNLKLLSREMVIRRSTYQPRPFWRVAVPKRGVETRPKEWLYPEDDLVIQSMVNGIGHHIEHGSSAHSFGYRLEKDPKAADQIFENWIERYSNYRTEINRFFSLPHEWHYIITDLTDFYPSVRHDDLLGMLATDIEDREVLSLLHKFVRYQWQLPSNRIPSDTTQGVSQGPPYARVLANLYMNSVDAWLQRRTKAFARYVDDVCMVFDSKEAAEAGLIELRDQLDGLGLSVSSSKTSSIKPLTDLEGIVDLFRQARYEANSALQGVNSLSNVSGEELTRGLQSYFSSVTNPNDLIKAAQHLNLMIKSQRRLLPPGAKQAAVAETLDAVYVVLRAGPVKAVTLRGLIGAVLEYYQGRLPAEFTQLIIDGSDHLKLIAIEVIASHQAYCPDSVHLLKTLAQAPQATLTRSAAFTALHASGQPIDITWLEHNIRYCDGFTKARAVLCYLNVDGLDMFAALNGLIASCDPDIIGSILYVLIENGESGAARPLLSRIPLECLERASLVNLFVYACLRFSCCAVLARSGLLEMRPTVAQVMPDLIAELRNDVLTGTHRVPFSALAALLDDVATLPEPVRSEAHQSVSYACKVVMQSGGDGIPITLRSPDSSPWGSLEVHSELSRLPGGGRRFFRSQNGDGSSSIIELVAVQDIAANSVTPRQLLQGYLALPAAYRFPAEIIDTIPDPLFVAFRYNVPASYSPAAIAGRLLPQQAVAIVKRLSSLSDAQMASNAITPVLDPFHVFLSPNDTPRVLGISSAIGIQTYVSRNLKGQVEQSGSPNVLFAGLLLFELVSGKCPFAEVKRLEEAAKSAASDLLEEADPSGARKIRLIDSPDIAGIPHVKWIIQKATLTNSIDRYDSLRIMERDLNMALEAMQGRFAETFQNVSGLRAFDAHGIRLRHLLMSKGLRFRGNYTHVRALVASIFSLLKESDVRELFVSHRQPYRPVLAGPLSRYERFAQVVEKAVAQLPGPLSAEVWRLIPALLMYFALRLQVTRVLRLTTAQLDPTRHKPAAGNQNFLDRLYSACTNDTELVFFHGSTEVYKTKDGLHVAEHLLSLDRLVVANQPEPLFQSDLKVVACYLALCNCTRVEIHSPNLAVPLSIEVPSAYRLPEGAPKRAGLVINQLHYLEGFTTSILNMEYSEVQYAEYVTATAELNILAHGCITVLGSVWRHHLSKGGVLEARAGFLRLKRYEVKPDVLINDPKEHLIPRQQSEPIRLDVVPSSQTVVAAMLYPVFLELASPVQSSHPLHVRWALFVKRLHWRVRLGSVIAIAFLTVVAVPDLTTFVYSFGISVIASIYVLWLLPTQPVEES